MFPLANFTMGVVVFGVICRTVSFANLVCAILCKEFCFGLLPSDCTLPVFCGLSKCSTAKKQNFKQALDGLFFNSGVLL